MFASTTEEKQVADALYKLGQYAFSTGIDPALSINQVMERVQWLMKGYSQINKGLIRIKTKGLPAK